jgi:hypothetical protein
VATPESHTPELIPNYYLYSLHEEVTSQPTRAVKIPIGNCQEQTPSWFSDDRVRNQLILHDLIQATADGRSPLLLTGRTDHLKYFDRELAGKVNNVFMLKVAWARNNDDR